MADFIRKSAVTYWHQSCTAKMGRDEMSVVDHQLKVYGIDNLRIADASIMPRITTGNTMAPCVVIGERAADMIRQQHGLARAELPWQPGHEQSPPRIGGTTSSGPHDPAHPNQTYNDTA